MWDGVRDNVLVAWARGVVDVEFARLEVATGRTVLAVLEVRLGAVSGRTTSDRRAYSG